MLYSQISDEPQATDNMECSPPAEDCAEVEDVGDAVEEVIGEDHAAVEVLHFLFACCILNVNLRNIKITIHVLSGHVSMSIVWYRVSKRGY